MEWRRKYQPLNLRATLKAIRGLRGTEVRVLDGMGAHSGLYLKSEISGVHALSDSKRSAILLNGIVLTPYTGPGYFTYKSSYVLAISYEQLMAAPDGQALEKGLTLAYTEYVAAIYAASPDMDLSVVRTMYDEGVPLEYATLV